MKSRLLFLFGFLMSTAVVFGQFSSIGIIGSATPGGWDNETALTQVNDSIYTIDITLTTGEAKFRADNAWTTNWGSRDFPGGTGVQDGPNIPVFAGDYSITFNSVSGEYYFDVDSDISIIGDATPGGWENDTKMYRLEGDTNKYYITVDLINGSMKFRTTGSWDTNWGSADFPVGVGVQDGDNIPVVQAGTYDVSFDKSTGEYSFDEVVDFESIGIIGNATPGGWGNETPMIKSNSNPDLWRLVLVLTDGEVKFRANNSWDLNWGGTDFPAGVGVEGSNDNIPVTAGEYIITFNTSTLEYNFQLVVDYESIGIIGDATPGGWDNETAMNQDPSDKTVWKLRVTLTDGELKFRANNDWDVNWGSGDFPIGVGEQDGANIPVTAGDYFIDFNSVTGAYVFTAVVEYDAISLVGKSGPFNDWPGDDDSRDAYLSKDPNDFNLWTLNGVVLTNYADVTDGGIKFRANAAWAINWGAREFPGGVGVLNGPNIEPVAGTYNVVFRSDTGEYLFTDASSTVDILDPAKIKVFPNPAKDFVNIEVDSEVFYGQAQLIIYDVRGNQVMNTSVYIDKVNTVNISALTAGNYIINIKNDNYLIGKNLIIAK
ncbi:MAG: SusF/SusE family outer membrane protein [Saprospiraceae bacterium]|nr:SusF/SusE family outer membrane protein [Saprospiraceae bacterium]